MYSRFQLAKKFLAYYLGASNGKGHGMHSPFIFHFITKVLNNTMQYAACDRVEELRHELLADKTMLTVEDFGAGSSLTKTNLRSVASIAKNAAKPKKFGQLLFRMVHAYKPSTILELGTSLGITTSYLSAGNPAANIITLEGAGEIAAVARKNFKKYGIEKARIVPGNFDSTLAAVLSELPGVDFVFVDGNHRKEPTIRYFLALLPRMNNDSILVFDDIHWSLEMEQAWDTIKAHPSVRCTVDLFFIGIVFFRGEFKEKRDFSIRF